MAKVWVLDTETKGTGAQMLPLEKVVKQPGAEAEPAPRSRKRPSRPPARRRATPAAKPKVRADRHSTPLPAGHVRKKATGEVGRVQSVDANAGTASVRWLRSGRTSTVPLSAISRR